MTADEVSRLLAPGGRLGLYGRDVWVEDNLGIGLLHRSPVVGTDRGTRPHRTPDGRLVLAADVRLDARDDLMNALDCPANERAAMSDEALLLAAYVRWGADCPRRLCGDFAFVIYDRRTRELFGATDALGIRRLFFAELETGVMVMASEEACLIGVPELAQRWSDVAVACWMMAVPHRHLSLFERIGIVAGGQEIRSRDGTTNLSQWWRPTQVGDIRYKRQEDYVEHYLSLLRLAVTDRLPPGSVLCELSGGLDSSTVTALTVEAAGTARVAAISHLFPGFGGSDESEAVLATRTRLGLTDWRAIINTPGQGSPWEAASLRQESPSLFRIKDQEQILKEAERLGRTVIFSGLGGDEQTQGHSGFAALARLLRADRELLGELREASRRRGRSLFWHTLDRLKGPIGRRLMPQQLAREIDVRRLHRTLVPPWLRRRKDLMERMREQVRHDYRLAGPEPYRRQLLLRFRRNSNLMGLDSYRWSAGERGLDVRTPFFDLRLTNFALATPPDLWCRGDRGKHLVREAFRGRLPDSVLTAKKVFFTEVAQCRWAAYREAFLAEIASARAQPGDGVGLAGLFPDLERDLAPANGFTLLYSAALARWSNDHLSNERGLNA